MAIYWHPMLAQLLRSEYGDQLTIEEEVNLGEMPLRIDLVVIRRDPAVSLPFPFDHLGATTLVSFKGPLDVAGQADLRRLEIYGLLYQERYNLPRRPDLTLWLLASHYQRRVTWRDGAYLSRGRTAGPGVRAGSLDRFPVCLVDLNELPVETATWPLVMVSRGPAERPLVEYFLDHQSELNKYWRQLLELHGQSFLEVIQMRQQSLEESGIEDLDKYVAMLVKVVGNKERLVRALGEEQAVRALVKWLGADRVREMVQQVTEEAPPEPDQN
jgi:hypothetical protein